MPYPRCESAKSKTKNWSRLVKHFHNRRLIDEPLYVGSVKTSANRQLFHQGPSWNMFKGRAWTMFCIWLFASSLPPSIRSKSAFPVKTLVYPNPTPANQLIEIDGAGDRNYKDLYEPSAVSPFTALWCSDSKMCAGHFASSRLVVDCWKLVYHPSALAFRTILLHDGTTLLTKKFERKEG